MRPILFNLGSIPIRSFGLMVLVGFMLALWYASSQTRKRNVGHDPNEPGLITPDHVFDIALGMLISGIIGARTLYILLDLPEFRQDPMDVFRIWTGGISIHGAITGGTLYIWFYCRKHKLSFLKFGDLAAPCFAIGYAVGRIGCFLNGCCYGSPCDLPWATRFIKDGHSHEMTPPSHPTQLYATGMNLIFLVILHKWSSKPHKDGELMLGYFGMYLVYRFIDEIFRHGATANTFVLGLTHSQTFSLAALPIVVVLLLKLRKSH